MRARNNSNTYICTSLLKTVNLHLQLLLPLEPLFRNRRLRDKVNLDRE
jgi:hypothetical protein